MVSYSNERVEVLDDPTLESAAYSPYFSRNHYQWRCRIYFLLCEDIEVDNNKGEVLQEIVIDGPVDEPGYHILMSF
jgi:hypothetical protein